MSQVAPQDLAGNSQVNGWSVKLTLLLVSTLTVMAGATIAPALPAMKQYFVDVPNADYLVRLVLTAPALFIALAAPIVGIAIDKIGRKPLLLVALLLYGIAGSTGLYLNQLGFLLVGRVFLGLAVAGIMTPATALVADYYAGPARAKFLGLQSAFMSLGGVFFLSFGGFLADLGWRMPFLLYLVALLLVPCVALFLPEPQRVAGVNSVQLDSEPFPTLAVAVTYAAALSAQVVFYLIPTQLPFYLKSLVNAPASQSGLAIALGSLFTAVASLLYQRIKSRVSFMTTYSIAFFAMALGYAMISKAQGYALVLPGLIVTGLGLGLLSPNMVTCLTNVAPIASRGKVLGGLTTAMFLGQFLSPLISQFFSRNYGLDVTYGLGGGVMVCLGLISLLIQSRWK